MMIRYFGFFLTCIFIVLACTKPSFYQATLQPSNATWTYNEPLSFDFRIEDTTAFYDLFLEVQHSPEYPFQNLYVKIITKHPEGEPQEDIVSLELANELGLWEGKCKGERCKVIIPLQTKARFDKVGVYTLQFNQYTRTDSLNGVLKLGLQIQKMGAKR